jgi:hypothetical protein
VAAKKVVAIDEKVICRKNPRSLKSSKYHFIAKKGTKLKDIMEQIPKLDTQQNLEV